MSVHDLIPLLPEPAELRRRALACAAAEAAASDDGAYLTYHFTPEWGPGTAMMQLMNGSGDDLFIAFTGHGVFLWGFDHESEVSPWREHPRELWPGLLDGLPPVFGHLVDNFADDGVLDATFAAWWTPESGEWRCGPVEFPGGENDGAMWLCKVVAAEDPAAAFGKWAADYYGVPVDGRWAFAGDAPPDGARRDAGELAAALREMGYPGS
ncbi:hypothetical protein Afil01_57380 [Actinorhabdospora filicis]|uniref:Uncharacterized protein n=1 Tax=Actinorhabdospora filicis TaxID=1785913 RepID=A0A9W6WCT9_9ACTN|nr:hypothetical protein [Actinorhabdospora filicis]GLZ80931.1 hypothetical protein Afil01_57380 [Actinorhabdospora filicis]